MTNRELDAWIAEHVFGKTVRPCRSNETFPPDGDSYENHGWTSSDLAIVTGYQFDMPLPRYSTDIAAAWTVVEKMKEYGWAFALETTHNGDACAVFNVGTYIGDDLSGPRCVSADTAPMAICLAAKAAIDAIAENNLYNAYEAEGRN